jgi:hypothetical protein
MKKRQLGQDQEGVRNSRELQAVCKIDKLLQSVFLLNNIINYKIKGNPLSSEILNSIKENLMKGKANDVKNLCEEAVKKNIPVTARA